MRSVRRFRVSGTIEIYEEPTMPITKEYQGVIRPEISEEHARSQGVSHPFLRFLPVLLFAGIALYLVDAPLAAPLSVLTFVLMLLVGAFSVALWLPRN